MAGAEFLVAVEVLHGSDGAAPMTSRPPLGVDRIPSAESDWTYSMTATNIPRSAIVAACADMIRACGLTVAEIVDELAKRQAPRPMLTLPVVDQGELNAAAAPAPPLPPAPFPEPAPAAAPPVATLSAAEVRSIEVHAAKVAGSKKAPAPMGARTPHKPKPAPHQNVTFSPPKPPDEARPRGEAIKTEKTVETIDTTKRANNRLEALPPLPPDPRWPSFSSMRPGVNPDTGKAWEARA